METFFGLGLIVGPTLGGALYQYGGYMAPFTVLGTLLFAAALITYAILPSGEFVDLPSEGCCGFFLIDWQHLMDEYIFLYRRSLSSTSNPVDPACHF